jgi:predicted dienelactone hydrolase
MLRGSMAVFAVLGIWSSLAEGVAQMPGAPLAVDVADGLTLQAAAGRKTLPYKVHFPANGGPFPVIVFSHGFGGNKDAFAAVGRHWASQGYVVIHPTHADGLGRRQPEPRARDEEQPEWLQKDGLLKGLNDPARIADRVADIVLVMDSLAKLEEAIPSLEGRIDAKRIGVGGHSFGAYTAMLIGGVTVDLGGEKSKSFRDERVMCILPISGQGAGQQGLTNTSWNGVTVPMMTITGTRDRGVGGQTVDWKREPYEFSPPGDKYLVVIEGANHFSFGGRLGVRSSHVTDMVNTFSTYFWDTHLKDSKVSREYLQSDRPTLESDGAYVFERK